jgi:hypothetical protein
VRRGREGCDRYEQTPILQKSKISIVQRMGECLAEERQSSQNKKRFNEQLFNIQIQIIHDRTTPH